MIRTLFVHIPKNAGTSIYNCLKDSDKHNIPKWSRGAHLPHSYLLSRAKLYEFKPEIQFCVVRNPYDRFISIYHHVQKRMLRFCKKLKRRMLKYPHEIERLVSSFPSVNFLATASFDDFVRKTLCEFDTKEIVHNYHHFMSQSSYIDRADIEIFRFEDLTLLEKRLSIKIPYLNVGGYDHDIKDLYYKDKKTKKIIEVFYEKDFENFKY